MVTDIEDRAYSDVAIPPGELLEEELKARGMSQKELALRTGRPEQTISEIVNGKKSITQDTALELEKVLGIPAHMWVNLEADYQLTLARNRDRAELEKQEDWLAEFPVKQLRQRELITGDRDKQKTLASLLQFFGVASFDALRAREASVFGQHFRITGAAQGSYSTGALWAWLRCGALDAREMEVGAYNERSFKTALRSIRRLTMGSIRAAVDNAAELCSGAGVAFVVTREFPKSGANGVTRWLASDKPLIQLSTRWSWTDIFWFTFYHEAKHVLDRQKKRAHVDLGRRKWINGTQATEDAADAFARDSLIPPEHWTGFVQSQSAFTAAKVKRFAEEVGVGPGIVVGRLQHEGHIQRSQLNNLRGRIVWTKRQDGT